MCRYFYPKLDQLLVEETLVGRSAACREALRPLALSMLAELIHHVRTQLKYGQLVTIIHTFSRCVGPPGLETCIHTPQYSRSSSLSCLHGMTHVRARWLA
jgi:transformation/transcription domain-associated protein